MISPQRALSDVSPSSALLWAEFRTQFDVNGVRKTENLARHPLAPRLLTLGDGTTANTIPAQIIGRHGLVFTGTQYVDTGIVDPFERTDRFTLVVVASVPCPAAGYSLIASTDASNNERGIELGVSSTGQRTAYLISTWTPSNRIGIATAAGIYGIRSQVLSYSGASTAASARLTAGEAVGSATADTLSTTIKSGKSFLLGAKHNGASKTSFYTGNMHFAAIFPWELTPQQVQYLHRLRMTRINAA